MLRSLTILICCCILLAFTHVQAQDRSQPLEDLRITQTFSNQSLQSIFTSLQENYALMFFYKEEWLPTTGLSKSYSNQPLGSVLEDLLGGSLLSYYVYDNYAVIVGRESQMTDLSAFSFQDFVAESNTSTQDDSGEGYERLIVGDSTIRPQPAYAMLRGSIFNTETEEGLSGARVLIPSLKTGANGDDKGNFSIRIPTGTHFIQIEAPGHELSRKQVRIFSDGNIDIAMAYSAYEMDEVLLEAENQAKSVRSTSIGQVNLSMIDVQKSPSLMGEADIINTILLLPGVSTVGESASGFNVRGGNIDQNLIMQDGNMIFNSSHLLGFFSIFNPDVVQGASLYKGHIPAEFGGRVSSVLDVELMEGSYRKAGGKGSVGLFSSKLSLDGPIQKGKSSYVVGVRGAYPSFITQYLDQVGDVANSSSWYGDFTAKVTQKFGDNHKLSVYAYGSKDLFRFTDQFGYEWSTLSGGLKYQAIINSNASLNLNVNGSTFESNVFNGGDTDGSNTKTGLTNLAAKLQFQYTPGTSHNLLLGIQGNLYDLAPLVTEPDGEESFVVPTTFEKDQGLELAAYISDEYEINTFVSVYAGLRVSMFRNMGPFTVYDYSEGVPKLISTVTGSTDFGSGETISENFGVEPRFSVRFLLTENTSFKASYNRAFQYIHLLSNTASATPIDLWQVSNTYFPAQRADNYSAGFFRNFRGNLKSASLEFFYRDMEGLVIAKDFARLLSSPQVETEVLTAIGQAYGGEFAIEGDVGKFNLNASLTYQRSLRQIPDNPEGQTINKGDWFPSDFDSPWNSTITLKYQLGKNKTLTANFIYRSGRPVTVPTGGTFSIYPSWLIPTFSDRNTFRIPNYHRLDLAYTFEDGLIQRDKLKTDFTISIYNVYARKNAFSVFFQKDGTSYKAFQLSVLGTILPFISYNFRF